jgi:hypothetical protein
MERLLVGMIMKHRLLLRMLRRWLIKLYLHIFDIRNMNLSLDSLICIIFIKFVGKKTTQSILRMIYFLKEMNKTFLK